jgi:hypothetical protein
VARLRGEARRAYTKELEIKASPVDQLAAHNKAEAGRLRDRELRAREQRSLLQDGQSQQQQQQQQQIIALRTDCPQQFPLSSFFPSHSCFCLSRGELGHVLVTQPPEVVSATLLG